MRIIHISDNALGLSCTLMADNPEILAKKILENHANTEVFIINVNYKTENITRADNAGILFLKYLRLNHFNQHCVLYSFLSREQLMIQDPYNSIIFSEGVTFIRMPMDLIKLDYITMAEKKAPKDLSVYFRGEIRLPEDERHNWANWWGIERLWEVHQSVTGKNKKEFSDYKSSLFFKKMESLEASIAKYLYPTNNDQVKEAQRESEISKLENEILVWSNLIAREIKSKKSNPEYITSLKSKISKNRGKINSIEVRANEGEELRKFREVIGNHNKKIVLIDDQSNEGWELVFKNILYGENTKLYSNLSAPTFDNTNTCLQFINKDTDIVLLDLRLKKEQGSNYDVTQLSGTVLLKKIVIRHPGIPVIIITASNKFMSYQTIMNLGADAYWIKEGLDSRFNEKETFENYRHFLNLIAILSGREYKLLKKFSQTIEEIKLNRNPWWATHHWSNPNGINRMSIYQAEGKYISKITELLDYGVLLYRTWLKMFMLNYDNDEINSNNKSKLLANIINALSGIVELVHLNKSQSGVIRLEEIGAFFGRDIKKYRCDFLGFYLYCMRNTGSHICGSDNMSYNFFEFYIKILLTWLSVSYSEIGINDVGIYDSNGFKDVYNPDKIIKLCEEMILTKSNEGYKYNDYAQFYLNNFK